jgi:Ca2+-binding RTX toxin-like protein
VQGIDNIDIGGGNDTVYGNWGLNTLNAGNGSDTYYGYGLKGNNVSLGNGNDTVYAYYPGNYDLNGTGTSKVYDNYTPGSTVNCATKKTTVYAVKGWKGSISNNCTVVYESAQTPPKVPSLKHHAPAKAKRHHKRHHG